MNVQYERFSPPPVPPHPNETLRID